LNASFCTSINLDLYQSEQKHTCLRNCSGNAFPKLYANDVMPIFKVRSSAVIERADRLHMHQDNEKISR